MVCHNKLSKCQSLSLFLTFPTLVIHFVFQQQTERRSCSTRSGVLLFVHYDVKLFPLAPLSHPPPLATTETLSLLLLLVLRCVKVPQTIKTDKQQQQQQKTTRSFLHVLFQRHHYQHLKKGPRGSPGPIQRATMQPASRPTNQPTGFTEREALNAEIFCIHGSELRICVKVEVAVLGFPS